MDRKIRLFLYTVGIANYIVYKYNCNNVVNEILNLYKSRVKHDTFKKRLFILFRMR